MHAKNTSSRSATLPLHSLLGSWDKPASTTNVDPQYSIYVLESSTSGRLTYFMPPLNLIPLLFLRPLRLVLPSEDARRIRIVALKATHAPFVAVIWLYERAIQAWARAASALASRQQRPPAQSAPTTRGGPFANPGVAVEIDHRAKSRPAARMSQHAASGYHARPRSLSMGDGADTTATSSSSAELVALVQALSTKVDDLAAMIAAGQQASA